MACGVSCVKYLVFVFNLLFALTGLTILTVGAIIESAYHHYSNFVGSNVWSAPILLIVVGSLVFIIAFVGCCGALKESSCMVLSFSIFLIIIFLCEIGIGIAGYVKHGQLGSILEKGFNTTMNEYEHNEEAWKLIQTELECCGTNGPEDWKQIFHNNTLPTACCVALPVGQDNCDLEHSYTKGCMPKLLHLFESNALIIAGVGVGIALVQLIGVCYACCLYRAFRRNYETV